MSAELSRSFHPGKRRGTPIPVPPPRIPTPMPAPSNNNVHSSRSATVHPRAQNMRIHPSSVGPDVPRLITKTSYKLLDNDVKTAWINPRLISKVDMEMIKRTEYVLPPPENNMNEHLLLQRGGGGPVPSAAVASNIPIPAAVSSSVTTPRYQQSQNCGRSHDTTTIGRREWESSLMVNGRAKLRAASAAGTPSSVPAPTQVVADAKRSAGGPGRKSSSSSYHHMSAASSHHHVKFQMDFPASHQQLRPATSSVRMTNNGSSVMSAGGGAPPKTSKHYQHQQGGSSNSSRNQRVPALLPPPPTPQRMTVEKVKGVVGAAGGWVGGGGMPGVAMHNSSAAAVFGVYSETKYTFAVNGMPGNSAQASAAAAFFARAAQKLNLSSSPHRRKRHISEEPDSSGFCGVLQRTPPPVPPALLRRIGVREVTGVGKVKVMLRVSNPLGPTANCETASNNCFSLDKRKKQVNLIDPTTCGSSTAPEDRRVGVAAPKMFAFDAIFSQDDSQTEVCSSALTDVIHAVINGNDGCLFCFGHAGLGKSYTMLGTPENANTLGIIPCAISWLFKGINEQKQKTGARFSVRVSALEVCGPTNQMRDLLAGYASDSEQSPGVYLRDDPLFGNQPPHCELRVPTAEKAAYYLDAAIENRAPQREDARDSHLLFTLHVYQYSVAGKGGVAGGRSRLHLIDLGNSDRGKASGGIPLSGVGNILLGIFNGQKHLPYKEHRLTQLLKDCLSSLTCHAAMIAHVSPSAQNYSDTLTTVQLASRIHRMRRRRIKFVSAATGNGSGGSSGEEHTRTTGTSSEPDPSSSDLSADTVIYVGPTADDATDGEHPPVYIPSLNSGDNRCSMSKALRGSCVERPKVPTSPASKPNKSQSVKTSPAHTSTTPKSSPSRIPKPPKKSDEQWIDGPRISKSKVAEARHLMKEACHVKKRETWIDGPMQESYGYMDSHKKNMIRQWVEHQTSQIQKTKHPKEQKYKELTQFKTYEEEVREVRPLGKKQENVEESTIRTGLKLNSFNDAIPECDATEEGACNEDDDEEVKIPPALPLIQPLSSREVSLESLDNLLKERMLSNAEYYNQNYNDEDEILEIIEVEEPLEPVPTADSCLQVTEEDIAYCMGIVENPLPEVDQENPLDHPLRILSQENLTVVSTFTDSMSVYTDLERILPRHRYDRRLYNDDYEDPDNPNGNLDETTKKKFEQLAKLHELYTNRLAKANVANSETYQRQKTLSRCESLSMTDMLYGDHHDNGSIYSEPAYVQEKFCENCKISMSRPATVQNWYTDLYMSASQQDLTEKRSEGLGGRFQRYCHNYDHKNLAYLRHPDGASNPNLQEETRVVAKDEPLPPPNSLPSVERMNRAILSIESGVTAIKLTQKSEGYDSGHDSTPRTSKHSPAAISRRAESGYDSVVRDSESSSIDSDTSRLSHVQGTRRGKCKHKHEKSFCSWFLNPFTCKYIEDPPETHF